MFKKIKHVAFAAVVGAGIFTTAGFTHASNDNHDFSFDLLSYHGNNYSGEIYRQTTDTSNKWKVEFTYSAEGKGTVATFWLDKKNHGIVSDTYNVTQGSGAKYYTAYKTANKANVRLGAENNNYTANTYAISGYWDEEIN